MCVVASRASASGLAKRARWMGSTSSGPTAAGSTFPAARRTDASNSGREKGRQFPSESGRRQFSRRPESCVLVLYPHHAGGFIPGGPNMAFFRRLVPKWRLVGFTLIELLV